MEDITDSLQFASTPPKEAAQNIDRANVYDMPPDEYKTLKPELDQDAELLEIPTDATKGVAEFAQQSEQHSSLVKNDIEKLNYFERYSKYLSNQMGTVNTQRDISEIIEKEFTDPESITEHDRLNLEILIEDQDELGAEDFGIDGTLEQLPAQVAVGISQVWEGIKDNKELVTGIVGLQTVAGALATAPIPIPGARVAGALAGFGTGVANAALVAGFLDGYKQMRNSMFVELGRATKKTLTGELLPLDIPRETKIKVSIGVGLVGGIVSGAVGQVIIKKNPFLKKFLTPKAAVQLITNPALRAKLEIIGNVVKSIGAGTTGGGIAEFARIVGEQIAKTDDEESFNNMLDTILSEESLKRIGHSSLIGGATAGTISTALNVPGYKSLKGRFEKVNKQLGAALGDDQTIVIRDDGTFDIESVSRPKPSSEKPITPLIGEEATTPSNNIKKASKVLSTQDTINNLAKVATATELNEISPSQMGKFRKAIMRTAGINKNVWLHIEDMREFSNDPERAEAVRKLIDPSGVLNTKNNVPIQAPLHKMLPIIEEYPEFSDYVRLAPEEMNPREAKNYANRLIEAKDKRAELIEKHGGEKLTPEQELEIENVLIPVEESKQKFTEFEYYNKPTFTEAIKGVMTKEEIEVFNTAQLDAQLAVSKSLKADIDDKFQISENRIFRDVNQKDIQVELEKIDSDLKVVERFKDRKNVSESALAITKNHAKKGFSPSAIDPKHLPENLREILVNEPTLKKNKVFVKGGLSLDESAALSGVASGDELLKILANTPTKKEVLDSRKFRKIELRNRIRQTLKPTKEIERDNALDNLSKIHLREMKFMREKRWTQTKSGIKKIVLPLPTIEGLANKAKLVITNTKVGELNHNQYMVGERKSQRQAVNHILKNEVEQAFKAKENAAQNIQLARETLKAQSQVTRNNNFLKKLKEPKTIATLKEANMLAPLEELQDVFKLDLSKRGLSEKGSFDKWAKKMVNEGKGNFEIPERFNDIRESATEMTVDQHNNITNTLKKILHQAKMKNKLYKSFKKDEVVQTTEAIVDKSRQLLENHPDFNPKKAEAKPSSSLSTWEIAKKAVSITSTMVESLKSVALVLDEGKPLGFHYDLLVNELNKSELKGFEDFKIVLDNDKKIIELYGKKKFSELVNKMLFIPEFKDFPTLSNEGWIKKTDLMDLFAYRGDPEGLKRLTNYTNRNNENITVETIIKVHERELDESDVTFVQNFSNNAFKTFEESSKALHERTTGEEVTMVKGVSIKHRGKILPGGYYPLKSQSPADETKAQKYREGIARTTSNFAKAFGLQESDEHAQWVSSKMTDQGRLQSRSESLSPLKLDLIDSRYASIEAIIHDENFREVGLDLFKLYGNAEFVKNVKSVVGPDSYRVMYTNTVEMAGRIQERNESYFKEQFGWLDKMVSMAGTGHAVGTLGYSLGSMAIQFASLPNAALRMGKGGGVSIAKAAQKIAQNMNNLDELVKIAQEVYPKLKFHRDGIDDNLIKSKTGFIPKTYNLLNGYEKTSNAISTLKHGQQRMVEVGMSGMQQVDDFTKLVTALGTIDHFTSGKVERFPLEKLNKMNDSEKFELMQKYTSQIIENSLTSSSLSDKTVLEKVILGKLFTKYWTDGRNALNTKIMSFRKIKWSGKKTWEEVKDGEYRKASKEAKKLMDEALRVMMWTTLTSLIVDSVRDEDTPLTELGDMETEDDVKERVQQSISYVLSSVPNALSGDTPFVRDVKYGLSSKTRSDYKSVSIPLLKSFGDVAIGITGLADMLEDVIESEAPSISRTKAKGVGFTLSYLTGGVPVNGPFKIMDYFETETADDIGNAVSSEAKRLDSLINDMKRLFGDDSNQKNLIEDLELIQTDLLPNYNEDLPKNLIPEDTKELIKIASSEGEWNTLDPDTGAAGIYQFTEERWNEISRADDSLGLTENGRVSKDIRQQEKAMQWSLEDNVKGLVAFDIPVNEKTLFGSHKFGLENNMLIFFADGKEKLIKVLGEETANDPLFKNFKTVNSIKRFVSKKIIEAKSIDKN